MTETWLLNETISFDCPSTNIDFSSNNENFSKIKCTNFGQFERYLHYETPSNSIIVCSEESTGLVWSNSSYRTLIFAIPPTGDLLTWLQANGNKQVSRKSYDLSTSAKWATLSSGNHNVQIVAKASGYRDSEKSAAVTVNKPAATVTLSKGTYKFVSQPTAVSSVIQQDIVCTAAADTYSYTLNQIQVNTSTASTRVSLVSTVDVMVNSKVSGSSNYAWYNYNDGDTTLLSTSPTITIASDIQVQSDFYKWAITDGNLVKQVQPTGETWLLNETIDTNKSVNITSNTSCTINLLIDNQGTYISKSGTTINVFGGAGGPYIIDVDSSGNRLVYYDALGGWNSQYDKAYYKTNDTFKLRTIIFATPPTGNLLTWLQANASKRMLPSE